ncbi:MAG TPA: GAF domain-containing protein [Thermoanaerobaculia bacterium]|nr:GAF domain-containing protein [Thermoanaerobaculia bacterium]
MREISENTRSAIGIACQIAGGLSLAFAGLYGWNDFSWRTAALVTAGVLFLAVEPILARLYRARVAGLEHRDRALNALTELCHSLLELPKECELRVTLLRVEDGTDPPRLQAVTRAPDGRLPQLTMYIHQGVAGHCYRKGESAVTDEVKEFVTEMVALGFTKEQARTFKPTKTYLCVPVKNARREVIAVISCDSVLPGVFTPERVTIAEKLTPFFARLLTTPESQEVKRG